METLYEYADGVALYAKITWIMLEYQAKITWLVVTSYF